MPTLKIVNDESEIVAELKKYLEVNAEQAIRKAGVFRLGLSGGSVLKFLCEAIADTTSDLTKWRFFFCDERYVDVDDPESTFGVYKRELIPKTGNLIKVSQFATIKLELPLEQCALDYEEQIYEEFKLDETKSSHPPSFDILLLGMGPDGHTCSLFPGHPQLKETKRWIVPIDNSPKMPPKRITMTLPLINAARCCIFAMSGAGKADMIKRVFVDHEVLPAGLVSPTDGELVYIFDEAAGKYCTSDEARSAISSQ